MRILFTLAGGSGHLLPLVPIARAAGAVGHDIAFAARPWMVPKIERLGFEGFPSGSDVGLAPVRRPLVEVDMERELLDFRDGFGRRIARERATDLQQLYDSWRPDVVVWEETDFGAVIVAERLRLPHVNVLVTAAGSLVRCDIVGDALDEVRAEHGMAPDPECRMLSRHLVLSPFPLGFRDPSFPPPATLHGYRIFAPDAAATDDRPGWATALPSAPTVYFTLGTVFNHESGDLFTRVVEGLRSLDVNVLVTVGDEIDPRELGPQPAHVRVERYIDQGSVLPFVDAVVSHGGSGSVLGALAHGLPMVLVPMGADQPLNGERCAALGLGLVLDAVRATPADVRGAVDAVLRGDYRAAAATMRAELAALPGPEPAVELIRDLARA